VLTVDTKIAAIRIAFAVILAAILINIELDLACSLDAKVNPADVRSMQAGLQNALADYPNDSIAYVFSDTGNSALNNYSTLIYNRSEIFGTDPYTSTNVTADSLNKYLVLEVPTNRNLDVMDNNCTRISQYPLIKYSREEKLLLIYSLFDYLKRQENGERNQVLRTNNTKHIMKVIFSPDNKSIAMDGADNTITVLNTLTEKVLFRLNYRSSSGGMAFSPDGKMLAIGTDDSVIRILDSQTGKEFKNFSQNGSVTSIAFSPDGNVLASTGNRVGDTWIPMLWDLKKNITIGGNLNAYRSAKIKSDGHTREISAMAFNPNSLTLATCGYDNITRIWNARDGKQLFNLRNDGPVLTLAYSPDGKILATGSEDNTAKIWDAENGKELFSLNHDGPVQTVAFDPKPFGKMGWVIVTISNGNLTYWQASTGDAMAIAEYCSSLSNVAFSQDGIAAVSREDGLISLYANLYTDIYTFDTNNKVESMIFSPNGTLLAAVCDKSLIIWNIPSLLVLKSNITIQTGNINNESNINNSELDWLKKPYFIRMTNVSSSSSAILLSSFCEKLGLDARIIAEYGGLHEFKNISSNPVPEQLHAEVYLGKLNSYEKDIEAAMGPIRSRYNVSEVYCHVNLSTNEVWLNLDVASGYPGGPFEASPKQMQVYISRGLNDSGKSIQLNFEYSPENPNVGDSIRFRPSPVNGNIADWAWDLGDGSQAKGANVIHSYEKAGNFTIRLSALDQNSEEISNYTTSIEINRPPSAKLNFKQIIETNTFNASITNIHSNMSDDEFLKGFIGNGTGISKSGEVAYPSYATKSIGSNYQANKILSASRTDLLNRISPDGLDASKIITTEKTGVIIADKKETTTTSKVTPSSSSAPNPNPSASETLSAGKTTAPVVETAAEPAVEPQKTEKIEENTPSEKETTASSHSSKSSDSSSSDMLRLNPIVSGSTKSTTTTHPAVEKESEVPWEAAVDVAKENKTSAAPSNDTGLNREILVRWMGLIAGGFLVVIATAYRGREPPIDDDDEDIVSFRSNIDNKRSGG
jgi:WD40 repeat protein